MTKVIVLAKAPVAGLVKTRLCPPCTPQDAANIAEAALVDTLDAVVAMPRCEPVLVLDGERGPFAPRDVRVVPQRGRGLDERIANAFCDVGGPALLIGMDTPQVTPMLLSRAADDLASGDVDAVLGTAADGGWWLAGVNAPVPRAFLGVPMSTADTGTMQRRRFMELGLRTALQPVLRDVDTFVDACAVARLVPDGRFGAAVGCVAVRATSETYDADYAWRSAR